jgi:hypothetical protein
MNTRICYQDFALNVLSLDAASLKLKPETAHYIWDMLLESNSNFSHHNAETVFAHMNNLNVPPGHRHRKLFEAAGHTSMSVGDFIWIPAERTIWMVAAVGWRIWTTQELTEKFGEPIFNLFNGYGVRYEIRTPR